MGYGGPFEGDDYGGGGTFAGAPMRPTAQMWDPLSNAYSPWRYDGEYAQGSQNLEKKAQQDIFAGNEAVAGVQDYLGRIRTGDTTGHALLKQGQREANQMGARIAAQGGVNPAAQRMAVQQGGSNAMQASNQAGMMTAQQEAQGQAMLNQARNMQMQGQMGIADMRNQRMMQRYGMAGAERVASLKGDDQGGGLLGTIGSIAGGAALIAASPGPEKDIVDRYSGMDPWEQRFGTRSGDERAYDRQYDSGPMSLRDQAMLLDTGADKGLEDYELTDDGVMWMGDTFPNAPARQKDMTVMPRRVDDPWPVNVDPDFQKWQTEQGEATKELVGPNDIQQEDYTHAPGPGIREYIPRALREDEDDQDWESTGKGLQQLGEGLDKLIASPGPDKAIVSFRRATGSLPERAKKTNEEHFANQSVGDLAQAIAERAILKYRMAHPPVGYDGQPLWEPVSQSPGPDKNIVPGPNTAPGPVVHAQGNNYQSPPGWQPGNLAMGNQWQQIEQYQTPTPEETMPDVNMNRMAMSPGYAKNIVGDMRARMAKEREEAIAAAQARRAYDDQRIAEMQWRRGGGEKAKGGAMADIAAMLAELNRPKYEMPPDMPMQYEEPPDMPPVVQSPGYDKNITGWKDWLVRKLAKDEAEEQRINEMRWMFEGGDKAQAGGIAAAANRIAASPGPEKDIKPRWSIDMGRGSVIRQPDDNDLRRMPIDFDAIRESASRVEGEPVTLPTVDIYAEDIFNKIEADRIRKEARARAAPPPTPSTMEPPKTREDLMADIEREDNAAERAVVQPAPETRGPEYGRTFDEFISEDVLDQVARETPLMEYEYKPETGQPGGMRAGLDAVNLNQAAPQLVKRDETGRPMGVNPDTGELAGLALAARNKREQEAMWDEQARINQKVDGIMAMLNQLDSQRRW